MRNLDMFLINQQELSMVTYTVESGYKVYVCPRGNYFIADPTLLMTLLWNPICELLIGDLARK